MQSKTAGKDCTLLVPLDLASGLDKTFYGQLKAALSEHPGRLHLDCSQLEPVHSSHIGLLWQARDICRKVSVPVILENTNDGLLRTLEALDLVDFFDLADARSRSATIASPALTLAPSIAEHSAEFTADVAGVDRAIEDFLAYLEKLNLAEEVRFDLRTMFYEVATNIRSHAGLGDGELIRCAATFEDSVLRLVFEDRGVPFDTSAHHGNIDPQAAALNRQTRGFGISLIRRLADDISYERKDDAINLLSLSKHCGDMR